MRKNMTQLVDAVRNHSFRNDVATADAFIRKQALTAGQFIYDKFDRLFQKIENRFESFDQVMREGNYHSERKSALAQLLQPKKMDLPETVPAVAATNMVSTSLSFAKRLFWISVVAAFTTQSMILVGLIAGSIGASIITSQYRNAKKSGQEIIQEKNFAGQTVEGKRADLCRLFMAQTRIMNLADTFKRASLESTTQTIDQIVASVSEEAKRVKIVAPGEYGASTDQYEFSEPCIKLVNDEELTPISSIPTEAAILRLQAEFESNTSNDNQLRERVRELEAMVEKLAKSGNGRADPPAPGMPG
jgi:hypothetical protein